MIRGPVFCALMLALLVRVAIPTASAQQVPLQDKPFAEHKIVLQLSDGDARKQALVLSVANNLLKAYDPDKIAIEVVAFGPGIDLLLSGSERRKQVESLIAQGVRFDICLNTVDTIERETGKRPEFIQAATPVQVGVGQILFLAENGYTVVRPLRGALRSRVALSCRPCERRDPYRVISRSRRQAHRTAGLRQTPPWGYGSLRSQGRH